MSDFHTLHQHLQQTSWGMQRRLLPRRLPYAQAYQNRHSSNASPTPLHHVPKPQTHHLRAGGHKPLPLPPHMDAMKMRARRKHKQPKAEVDFKSLTPFQQKLNKNPYAHALASPIRHCKLTVTRLPSYFYLSFSVLTNPTTGAPWIVPGQLYSQTSKEAAPPPPNQPSSWLQCRHKLLSVVSAASGGDFKVFRNALQSVLNNRSLMLLAPRIKSVVWRPDMPDFVEGLLRKVVKRKMAWLLDNHDAGLVVECTEEAEGLDWYDDVGCVIYMVPIRSPRIEEVERDVDHLMGEIAGLTKAVGKHPEARVKWLKEVWQLSNMREMNGIEDLKAPRLPADVVAPPIRFETAAWRGSRVPVYSLVDLLGEEGTRELVEGTAFDDSRCLVLKKRVSTISAQMALGKLRAYLT